MAPSPLPLDDPLFSPRPRPSWVADQIQKFNRKLAPRWRREKFDEMARSSLAFYRGTDHLFWADLGPSDLPRIFGGKKATRTWICGDLHCDNFGSFADSTGRLVYDLVDFDEGVAADFQFDLWRLAVSLVLAGRRNRLKPKTARGLVESLCRGYLKEIKRCRWYGKASRDRMDEEEASGVLRRFLTHVRRNHGSGPMLEKWTEVREGSRKLKTRNNPDLLPLAGGQASRLGEAVARYAGDLRPWPLKGKRLFEVADAARRLHEGVGSHGLDRYYVLARVESEGKGQYLILDVKFQPAPASWNHLPPKARRKTGKLCGGNQALRVCLACRALGRHVDPWLGWLQLKGGKYSIRERSPYKAFLPNEEMDEGTAWQLGGILARAHCRAKKKLPERILKRVQGKKSEFRNLVQSLAQSYADQVEMDYRSFCAWKKKGQGTGL